MKHVSTHLKLLAVAVIWGLGWVAGRVAALEIPPFTAGWVRYIIAVSCFLMFLKIFLVENNKSVGYSIQRPVENNHWNRFFVNLSLSGIFHVWNEMDSCW